MNVLLVGNNGMLARDLEPRLLSAGYNVTGIDINELDITKSCDVNLCMDSRCPDIVINCAAYTAVDKAESESELAFKVNEDGPENLAVACKKLNIPLIHISTDYVFNGTATIPYKEDDKANPMSVYGKSKWEGEEAIRNCLEKHLIIRTAWLYGVNGNNFVKTMIRLAKEREEIRVVNDQKGCPTWTGDLADALVSMVNRIAKDMKDIKWGTYHYCGDGITSWHGFTKAIISKAKEWESFRIQKILAIPTKEYPTPAKRPMWSAMDCTKLNEAFGIRNKDWKQGLSDMLEELYRTK
jgi:dTDP-4-dehydrorhamnose reductase